MYVVPSAELVALTLPADSVSGCRARVYRRRSLDDGRQPDDVRNQQHERRKPCGDYRRDEHPQYLPCQRLGAGGSVHEYENNGGDLNREPQTQQQACQRGEFRLYQDRLKMRRATSICSIWRSILLNTVAARSGSSSPLTERLIAGEVQTF